MKTAQELSQIMYSIDPMGTCCNVNPGMENEYDQIAQLIVELYEDVHDRDEAMKRAIIFSFDDFLYERNKVELSKCLY